MIRILFVDDERSVLDGLRDSLRRERHRWDKVFAESGAEALAQMALMPFDIIITDMRMPVMDGAELLRRVRQLYPQTMRIVLSGQSEPDALLRVLPQAHQILAKPCAPEYLVALIERLCFLQGSLHSLEMRKLLGGLERLPSAPAAYHALSQEMATPAVNMERIVRIIERDPAIGAKILQLANSAYFGVLRPIHSVQGAVTYLGLDLIRVLTLSEHVFSTLDVAAGARECLSETRRHSFQIAGLTRRFLAGTPDADEVFATALVHDVGCIALAMASPERYRAAVQHARQAGVALEAVEVEAFGVSHAEAGAYLLGTWGLPVAMVEDVAYHHCPSRNRRNSRVLAALHVADALVSAAADGCEPRIDLDYVERAGAGGELEPWMRLAAAEPAVEHG